MNILLILFVAVLTGINGIEPDRNHLREVFHWDVVDFAISPIQREQAIATGSFIPKVNGIYSLGIWRDKVFVGIFRFRQGVLSSLNYFPLNTTNVSPILIPYPSFQDNYINEDPNNLTASLTSESSVINTGHFKIDKCNRLWIIDSGYTDFWGKKRFIAPQALVVFDLTTDTLLRRYVIPSEMVNPYAVLLSLSIDMEGDSCDDVHAYIVDMLRSFIVYSFKKDRAWIVEHSYLGSDPHEGNFFYQHINFQWNYGVFASAVGEKQPDGSRHVYFAPLASTKMYWVSNRILQDESYIESKYFYNFTLLGNIGKDGHAAQLVYDDRTEVLINLLFGRSTITCWNSRMPYQIATVHKTSTLFYPIHVDLDSERNLWILSSPLALYFYEEGFSKGVKNMRVFKETFDQAIVGTNCKNKQKS